MLPSSLCLCKNTLKCTKEACAWIGITTVLPSPRQGTPHVTCKPVSNISHVKRVDAQNGTPVRGWALDTLWGSGNSEEHCVTWNPSPPPPPPRMSMWLLHITEKRLEEREEKDPPSAGPFPESQLPGVGQAKTRSPELQPVPHLEGKNSNTHAVVCCLADASIRS